MYVWGYCVVTAAKTDVSVEGIAGCMQQLLVQIQADMFQRAKAARDENIVQVMQWSDFVPAIEQKKMVMTPFCDIEEWEEKVKVYICLVNMLMCSVGSVLV